MGLDAAVFKNVKHMEQEFGAGIFETDPDTGEAQLKPGVSMTIPRQARFAQKRRIGNIAAVGDLREAMQDVLPDKNSVILEKVIYSGTHGGDQINLSVVPALRAEVEMLKGHNVKGVPEFMADMLALIEAAEREKNPIVFL